MICIWKVLHFIKLENTVYDVAIALEAVAKRVRAFREHKVVHHPQTCAKH